ncbi:MAG: DUF6445 family protein [Gammaproteobacteria bacterium]
MTEFAVNPACAARVIHVGVDAEPVLVVDDLLSDPDAVVRHAQQSGAFRKDARDFYPGVRMPFSTAYAENVYRHLQALFAATFGATRVEPLSCLLSLATTRPEELRPIQSVPHFDSFEAAHIAGVHYLCSEAFGGTSFYRHRSTGYEWIDAARIGDYAPRLKAEVMGLNARSFDYIRGDTTLFERTGSVAAKFNRAVFYRSHVLHSGDISGGDGLSEDPGQGRLTANTLGVIRN